MPAVAPSNSESYLLLREPLAKFLFSNLLIGFAHTYKTPKAAQRSEQNTMDEKLVPMDLHLLEQQRLYHHFPAPGFTIGDAVHQGPSTEPYTAFMIRFSAATFATLRST
ncbi:hypothetical protein VDGE_30487 [Verticillium dahliae]|uniref:Uncharacterized protein n=1 Tax=Verticillium dahliae TaxID=27337 RepID=A0A444RSX7_VERDA|nr:hypothetical protein VDGE_30487 [Verticillium dahliae]